jgi:cytochrome c oxidase assembly protein subunit 15
METSALGGVRDRLRTLSPETFRRISYVAFAALFVVIATGAIVRLTASGLGCENWPRCGDTTFPTTTSENGYHAFIEFGNRVVAAFSMICAAVAALAARRVPGLPRWITRGWAVVALAILAQIPLGGLTVLLDLNPLLVMSHFLLALAAIGLAVVVTYGGWAHTRDPASRAVPRPVAWLAVLLVPLALGLVVSGTFVTAAGPHSGGDAIRRLGNLLDSVYIHVRVSAAFGIGFLLLLLALWRLAARAREELLLALGVLGLLVLQMGVGEWQYRTQLPAWLVFVHVMLATSVWCGVVLVATRLVARRT